MKKLVIMSVLVSCMLTGCMIGNKQETKEVTETEIETETDTIIEETETTTEPESKKSFFDKLFNKEEESETATTETEPIIPIETLRADHLKQAYAKYKDKIGTTVPGERIVEKIESDFVKEFSVYEFDDTGFTHKFYYMVYDDDLFEWNKNGRLNELTLARKSLEIDEEMKVVHFALEYVNMGNNPYEYFRSKINKAFEDEARLLDLDEGETVDYIEKEDDTIYSIVGSLDEHVIPAPELEQDEEGYELCLNDAEYFKYKTNDDGTITITGYNCEWLGNKLVIPAKIDDKEVYAVKVLEPLAGVTCVEIEQGVSEIIGAFKDWPDLNRVIMHDGLVSISEDAFVGTNITNVELPSSIMHLHDYFFKNYPVGNVGSFYPNITTLNAIYSESDIATIIIPGTVNIIDVNAFKDCKKLTTVFVQEGTTEIKANAFTGCNSLQAIALPASITHIDLEAIPKSVMLVGAAGTYVESFAKDNGYVYAVQ